MPADNLEIIGNISVSSTLRQTPSWSAMADNWASLAITLPREEDMHAVSRRECQWVLDNQTRLRLIDCTLPGLRNLTEVKKLEIATGYCKYLEYCLVENFEWERRKLKDAEQLQQRSQIEAEGGIKIAEEIAKAGDTEQTSEKGQCAGRVIERDEDTKGKALDPPPAPVSPRPPPPIPQRPTGTPQVHQPVGGESSATRVATFNANGIPLPQSGNPSLDTVCTDASIHKGSNGAPVDEIQASQASLVRNKEASEKGNSIVSASDSHVNAVLKRDIYGSLDGYIAAFLDVVNFFSRVFQEQYSTSISEFSEANPDFQVAFVFRMLSVWLCLQCFGKPTFISFALEPTLNLIDLAGTLPRPIDFTDSAEPLSEHRLHTFSAAFAGAGLISLGGIELVRTWDIGCHLYFNRANLKLYIFATAGFCYSQNHGTEDFYPTRIASWRSPRKGLTETPSITGIPVKYTQEVSRTIHLLFDNNPQSRKVFREFQKEFDDLRTLIPPMRLRSRQLGAIWTEEGKHSIVTMQRNAPIRALVTKGYHLEDFPYFAERLLVLEQYLNEVKPSSLRQLLQDSRDQMQYYTFIVAFVVFVLTILGLILSILQTVASFMQVSLALKQSSG